VNICATTAAGKAGSFISNLYGALDQGEEGDIVSRSIVCCRSGNPVGETQEMEERFPFHAPWDGNIYQAIST